MLSRTSGHAADIRGLLAATGQSLSCELRADSDAVTLLPCGELDMATAPTLDGDLRAARDLGFAMLFVDLRDLAFIDSAGVQLFVRWAAAAETDGFAFRLAPGTAAVQRVFEITGLADVLPFERRDRAAMTAP